MDITVAENLHVLGRSSINTTHCDVNPVFIQIVNLADRYAVNVLGASSITVTVTSIQRLLKSECVERDLYFDRVVLNKLLFQL
mmetsp:Transcript_99567/g.149107  ORF Transcript_99567/g.149107 Transcript_99567/m.149107 type:complete len:83 (-) Transcript_99567:125-373(-)